MKTELEYYDIYPKVLCTEFPSRVTLRALGAHVAFDKEKVYRVQLFGMNETLLNVPEESYPVAEAKHCAEGLVFEAAPKTEQQYIVLLQREDADGWKDVVEMRIYALRPDFFALRPFRGDMHCHTNRSDGKESPAIVAANYRKAGFDFLSITDHGEYAPSQEAIRAYQDLNLSFQLFAGEEVHPPKNNDHTVHFGGSYSVNEIFQKDPERYWKDVNEIAEGLDIPANLNRQEYASLLWVYREIRKAGGMAIMAHPCWIQDRAYHIRRDMYRYLLKTHPFDALELTCGESLEENQLQVSLWQQMREEGNIVPLVGSSDSHGTVNSEWFGISKMVVLAKACEKDALIDAVKKRQVTVLEQYHGEPLPRPYGENRCVEYVLFLVNEYFPLHDELCFEEGRLMKAYACGDVEAKEALLQIGRRTEKLFAKYWAS